MCTACSLLTPDGTIWRALGYIYCPMCSAKLERKQPLSDAERTIVASLRDEFKNGYMTRDDDNGLWVYSDAPQKKATFWYGGSRVQDGTGMNAFNHLFQQVKWTDSEPTKISDMLKW